MKKWLSKWWIWLIVSIVFSAVILKLDGVMRRDYDGQSIIPYVWIGLYGFGFCVVCAWRLGRDSKLKLVFFYLCIVPLCVSVGEIYGYFKLSKPTQTDIDNKDHAVRGSGTYTQEYFIPSQITGYKGAPNLKADSQKMVTDTNEIIYHVVYTTDDEGWRITPNSNKNSERPSLSS